VGIDSSAGFDGRDTPPAAIAQQEGDRFGGKDMHRRHHPLHLVQPHRVTSAFHEEDNEAG
jgi:hypothetical protein